MPDSLAASYDLICVGSGFASHFFLQRWLERTPVGHRALLIERGPDLDHAGHRARRAPDPNDTFENRTPEKHWNFTVAVGGSSNCWVGNTPRMLPNDFRTRSLYGVGSDWPVAYDELEPYYGQAERVMRISGPDDGPAPRSDPYPLPPHRINAFDRELLAAWPGQVFALPTARPSRGLEDRPRCCASSACSRCPIDSKFTLLNGMPDVTRHPRVTLVAETEVMSLDTEGGRVVGVRARRVGSQAHLRVRGDLVVLGANAIFNAAILLRTDPEDDAVVGGGLCEQTSLVVRVDSHGLESLDGSTYQTAHGYMAYDGPHRRDHAAVLLETHNAPYLIRNLEGRWRDVARFKMIFEDHPRPENRVTVDGDGPPSVSFASHSEYALRARDRAHAICERVLAPLPVERFEVASRPSRTEAHVMCTTPMGRDPESSVVDGDLVHHRHRNVIVAGASVFPTAAPANPTLTLCALSLRAADRLLS